MKNERSFTANDTTVLPPVGQISNGLTGAENLEEAANNLHALRIRDLDCSNGAAVSNENNKIKMSDLPEPVSMRPTLQADTTEVAPGDELTIKITNYDSNTTYAATAQKGSAKVVSDSIIYTAPAEVGKDTLTVNNRVVTITIRITPASTIVNTPTIISPAADAVGVSTSPTISASSFSLAKGTDSHAQSNWQLANDVNFGNIIKEITDSTNKTTWNLSGLSLSTDYYVRVCYITSQGIKSQFSAPIKFSTGAIVSSIDTPAITSPSNGSSNVAATASFSSSAYSAIGTETHQSSSWQLGSDAGFSTIVAEIKNSTSNKTSWTPSGMAAEKTYYLRVMYHGSAGTASAWSPTVTFDTKIPTGSIVPPTITSPISGSSGIAAPVTISLSAFTVTSGTDTHDSTVYEVATNSNFTNSTLYTSGSSADVTKTTLKLNTLISGSTYYIRAKYTGTKLGTSQFGAVSSFVAQSNITISTPTINAPASTGGYNYQGTSFTAQSSAFAATGGTDTHANSDWEMSTDSSFNTIFSKFTASTSNLTSAYFSGFTQDITYYLRVRHRGASGNTSQWSAVYSFRGGSAPQVSPIATPSITYPYNDAYGVSKQPTVTSSPFSSTGMGSHAASRFQIASDKLFNSVVLDSGKDSANKTSWTPTGVLSGGNYYFIRVKYYDSYNNESSWSPYVTIFTTTGLSIATPVVSCTTGSSTDAGYTGVDPANPTFNTSAFSVTGGADTHASSDWQIMTATDQLVKTTTGDTVNKLSWSPGALTANTAYKLRVKHIGSSGNASIWSVFNFTTGAVLDYSINTPTITSPANNSTDMDTTVNVIASAFSATVGTPIHKYSSWQAAYDASFSTPIWESGKQTANLTSWIFANLTEGSTFYIRVRYHTDTKDSLWSNPVKFTIKSSGGVIARPSIIYLAGSTVVGDGGFTGAPTTVQFVSSAFTMASGNDSHQSSDWMIADNPNFANQFAVTGFDTVNKTSWTVAGLKEATKYYVTCSYRGNKSPQSEWAPVVNFTTGSTAPNIGNPGVNITYLYNEGAGTPYAADEVKLTFDVSVPNADGATGIRIEYIATLGNNGGVWDPSKVEVMNGTYLSGNVYTVNKNLGPNGRLIPSSYMVLARVVFVKSAGGTEYYSPVASIVH